MIANGKEWRASIGYITNVDTVALTTRESLRPIMIALPRASKDHQPLPVTRSHSFLL